MVVRVVCGVVGVALLVATVTGTAEAGPGSLQGRGRPLPGDVRAELEVLVDEVLGVIPGLALAVERPGLGRFVVTAGDRTLEPGRPVTSSTKFRIGSVTKTFTATVVLQLVEEGRLSLDDTLDRWLPEVQFADRITVRMLLNMTSGIFDEGGPGSRLVALATADPDRVWTPHEVVDLAIQDGPVAPPGGAFSYSDTNYVILGIIAHEVTRTPIQRLIESRIIRPLHLTGTSYPVTAEIPPPAATGYVTVEGEGQGEALVLHPSVYGAAGAMISTLHDLRIWARAYATGALLSPATRALQRQTVPTDVVFAPLPGLGQLPELTARYGLGIIEIDGYLGHNGIVSGFTTQLWHDPGTGTTIVALLNGEYFIPDQGSLVLEPVAEGLFTAVADVLDRRPAPLIRPG